MEPFAGGAGLAIKLLLNGDVKRIVINDFDPAIFAFWYSVLNHTEDFCSLIQQIKIDPSEWQRQREIYLRQNVSNSLELGFSTFFLNRTNISGVIKGGMIGGLNQKGTYGIEARFNKPDLVRRILNIAKCKHQIVLLNMDARELLDRQYLRRFYKIFINFDPPYVKKGAKLYENSFCEEDHITLFEKISQCGRKWMVTYDVCPLVAKLYRSFRCGYLDVTYSVKNTKKAQEYIFFSNNLSLPEKIKIISLQNDCNSKS